MSKLSGSADGVGPPFARFGPPMSARRSSLTAPRPSVLGRRPPGSGRQRRPAVRRHRPSPTAPPGRHRRPPGRHRRPLARRCWAVGHQVRATVLLPCPRTDKPLERHRHRHRHRGAKGRRHQPISDAFRTPTTYDGNGTAKISRSNVCSAVAVVGSGGSESVADWLMPSPLRSTVPVPVPVPLQRLVRSWAGEENGLTCDTALSRGKMASEAEGVLNQEHHLGSVEMLGPTRYGTRFLVKISKIYDDSFPLKNPGRRTAYGVRRTAYGGRRTADGQKIFIADSDSTPLETPAGSNANPICPELVLSGHNETATTRHHLKPVSPVRPISSPSHRPSGQTDSLVIFTCKFIENFS
ncbi:unnamed protein product [Nesidiocoris tenuis]|uniref:Uncharacterized protein n=1 Tax=Nesidiocoris tenuis TaxID=355587 RepID=A0A6H5FW44_9HEMI|nr:unnamed protein product [Nesidiocoris tenuis]